MTAANATADASPPDAFDEGAAWELASLRELGDLCRELTRLSAEKARAALTRPDGDEAPAPPRGAVDPVRAFGHMARALRMTVGLHARIRKDRLTALAAPARSSAAATPADVHAAASADQAAQDQRLQGQLRHAMTRFIVETAIEAQERDREESDRLTEALDARLACLGREPEDFIHIDVKQTAYEIAVRIGAAPGEDWWMDSWGVEAGPLAPESPPGPAPKPESVPPKAKPPPGPSLRERLMGRAAGTPPPRSGSP